MDVDAAALNASNQIKEGYTVDDLRASAIAFLQLNGVNDPSVSVRTCDNDPSMCTTPERKLVAVTASSQVPTFFMSVLGFNSFPISAEAESEAATIDVILVIDVSESMTEGAPAFTTLRDPWLCSELNTCQPFEQVKSAAREFVDQLFFPYDRVGIVTFDRYPQTFLELTNDKQDILDAIDELKVYSGEPCPFFYESTYPTMIISDIQLADNNSVCRLYKQSEGADNTFLPGGTRWSTPPTGADASNWSFSEMFCPQTELYLAGVPDMNNRRGHCNSTNMGAGLALAGNALAGNISGGPASRDESLWVVILLADGNANVAYNTDGDLICPGSGHCRVNKTTPPYARYSADPADTNFSPNYDPVDYAFDMSEFLYGMEIYTFGIGLRAPKNPNQTDEQYQEAIDLMDYILDYTVAPTGHDEYQAPSRGIYYVAPTASELRAIFLKIANNIATRITR